MSRWSLLALLGLMIASSPSVQADDWPQWRGPNRDGISKETGLLPQWPESGPQLQWRVENAGSGYSTPAVVGDRMYLLGNEGNDNEFVLALSTGDGSEIWRTRIGSVGHPDQRPPYPGARSTPTVDGNHVCVLGSNGDLACLDASSGEIHWTLNVREQFGGQYGEWAYSESPLVDGDQVIVAPGGSEATVVALNRENGDVIWKTALEEADNAAYASAVISEAGGVKQYVHFLSKGLIGLEAETGKLLWRFDKVAEGSPANIPTPIVSGDYVYGGSNRGGAALLKLNRNGESFEVEEVYASSRLPTGIGGAVLVGDHLYGSTGQGLVCVDFKTGEIVWQDRSIGASAICVAEGNLYLHGDDGDVALVEVNPEKYVEQGRFSLPEQPDRGRSKAWEYPVVANGHLYLRDLNVVWSYDIAGK